MDNNNSEDSESESEEESKPFHSNITIKNKIYKDVHLIKHLMEDMNKSIQDCFSENKEIKEQLSSFNHIQI